MQGVFACPELTPCVPFCTLSPGAPSPSAAARCPGPGPPQSSGRQRAQEGCGHASAPPRPRPPGISGGLWLTDSRDWGPAPPPRTVGSGHNLPLTSQSCAEPLRPAGGGARGRPCTLRWDCWLTRLLCTSPRLAPPTPSDVFDKPQPPGGVDRPAHPDACPAPMGAGQLPCFCCLVGSFPFFFFFLRKNKTGGFELWL